MDFGGSHGERVAFLVEEDESFDPVGVCFGSTWAQVAEGGSSADLIEQFWWCHRSVGFQLVFAAHPAR